MGSSRLLAEWHTNFQPRLVSLGGDRRSIIWKPVGFCNGVNRRIVCNDRMHQYDMRRLG